MDRAEFLNRLEAQLLDVPQAEREEARNIMRIT